MATIQLKYLGLRSGTSKTSGKDWSFHNYMFPDFRKASCPEKLEDGDEVILSRSKEGYWNLDKLLGGVTVELLGDSPAEEAEAEPRKKGK